jgi:hypothetical protein
MERRFISRIFVARHRFVELRLPERVIIERELELLAGMIVNRRNFLQKIPQSLFHEPGVALELHLVQVADGGKGFEF